MTGAAGFGSAATPGREECDVRFSLVMAAHNAAATLGRAVDSVIAQGFGRWELIIVDDGSADETGRIAREYAARDARVTVLEQEHGGCGAARRAGALAARGEFVTKVDADDALLPDALERLSRFIDRRPGYDIYSAHGYKVYSDGTRTEVFGDPKYQRELSLTLEDLIDDCWIFGGAASIRRGVLERIGGFRAEVRCEDYDVWLRALAAGATHRFTPDHVYLWSIGVPGRMNEDPTRSFISYIAILNDLVASGVLAGRHVDLARASIEKFERRIRQLEETGTTDADFTNRQAARFKATVNRIFGHRLGGAVIALANRVKWCVKPIRVALARRERRKGVR